MKINTIIATNIAIANAIQAIGTQIVVASSSVSSFTSMMFRWRSDYVRGNRVDVVERGVVERSVMVHHLLGFTSHCLGLNLLAGLKPAALKPAMAHAADQACCAYRTMQLCQSRTT